MRVEYRTLLLHAKQFASAGEIVERWWDASPPSVDRAGQTLHMIVTRLGFRAHLNAESAPTSREASRRSWCPNYGRSPRGTCCGRCSGCT